MSEHFLTVEIFEQRMVQLDEKLDRIIERDHETALKTERRLTSLETNQASAGWIATWLSGIVALIVSGIMLALMKLRGE